MCSLSCVTSQSEAFIYNNAKTRKSLVKEAVQTGPPVNTFNLESVGTWGFSNRKMVWHWRFFFLQHNCPSLHVGEGGSLSLMDYENK